MSDDTDVFVLCVALSGDIPCELYLKSGTQARIKFTDITKVANSLGSETCKALIGLHSITGCDTVSAFAGKGKVAAMKIVRTSQEHREALQQLGTEWTLTPELFHHLQSFTCHLYNARASTNDVNELRYALFCAKKGEAESWQLPPCAAALRKHCQRANYQAGVWRHSLESCPEIPSPVGKGWCRDEEEHLVIDWSNVPAAPDAVLQFLSCKCNRACKMPTCTCLANGLRCTQLCMQADYLYQSSSG